MEVRGGGGCYGVIGGGAGEGGKEQAVFKSCLRETGVKAFFIGRSGSLLRL